MKSLFATVFLATLALQFVAGQDIGCYFCYGNPCKRASCPAYTGARCRVKCCKAYFFDKYGNDVTDRCQCQPRTRVSKCDRDLCQKAKCDRPGQCFVDRCGGCDVFFTERNLDVIAECPLMGGDGEKKECPPLPPGSVGICVERCARFGADGIQCPGEQLCCSNGCGSVCKDPYYPNCPQGQPLACKPPACDVTSCPRQIQAKCDPVCFGCIARFFDKFGNEVTKNCRCPNGVDPVSCVDDPCRTAKCGARRDVVCRTDTCGKCTARFYDRRGREVKCPTPERRCPPNVQGVLLGCKQTCRSDAQCGRNRKCCTYGCRKVCRTSVPPNCDSILCKAPGCDVEKCHRHILAKCQGTCNECFANFFDRFGNEINDQCKCRRNEKVASCRKDMCDRQTCPGYPKAECRINSCGKCQIEFYDENMRRVRCQSAAPTCPAVKRWESRSCALECKSDRDCTRGLKCCSTGCGRVCRTPLPADCNSINCFAPACDTTTCATHTQARCRGECNGCFALFFDGFGNDITSQCNCPGRIFEAECKDDLCDGKQCRAYPFAECRINRCGGCNVAFFDQSGRKVDCNEDTDGRFCPAPIRDIPVPCKQTCKRDGDCGRGRKCCTYGCRTVCRSSVPDCRVIRCAGPGCQLQSCPAHAFAPCQGSCNNCFANYFDAFGNEINDQCQCDEGVEIKECSKSVCSGRRCRRYPKAECRVNSCGGCRAEFYDEDKRRVNCDYPEYDERCPKVRTSDRGRCDFRCTSNKDCEGKSICCQTPGCGSACRSPPQDDRCPGKRPLIITNPPTLCLRSACMDNSDCRRGDICCDEGCNGRQCLSYPYVDPRCPPDTGVGPCINLCDSNKDCDRDEICCGLGCGTRCRKLFVQDKRCPRVNVNLQDPSRLLFTVSCPPRTCDTVDDCSGGQICCDIGCSRRCMRPPVYDDRCPLPVAPVSDISCEMECTSNSDCDSGRMCCGLYCGSKCTPMPYF